MSERVNVKCHMTNAAGEICFGIRHWTFDIWVSR